jgi:Ca2+-binding RTX toxin-like protein
VVFGKAAGFGPSLDLAGLDGGNGFQLSGERPYDGSGYAVSAAGDVNGDGFADVIVGAWQADGNGPYSGAAYVVFGKAGGFAANLDLSSLNGANGFQLSGEAAYDHAGFSVSSAGDVNGDGFDDLLIGARFASPNGKSGAAYVVFGKAQGFAANLDLSSLDGSNGFRIHGEQSYGGAGFAVSSGGDLNGDGFADLIVGAPYAGASGASYVIFGHRALEAVARVGTAIDNTINGGMGDDTVRGLGGDDRLIGWEGHDRLFGGSGDDRLSGRCGDDLLVGGAGRDVLIGGLGEDRFDFNAVSDSGPSQASRDVIRDFTHLEDQIDLSGLGPLAFIGTAEFTATGQVRVFQVGGDTQVAINLAGSDALEMAIVLRDVAAAALTAEDFIL